MPTARVRLNRSIGVCIFAVTIATQAAENSERELEYLHLNLEQLLAIKIFTGTKRDEPLKKIPASVTVITRHDIGNHGYQSLPELLRNLPSLYTLDDTQDLKVGLRGNTGGAIQVLLNGIPLGPIAVKGLRLSNRSQYNIPIEAVDRVELIRGPMSVIYGNNAFKGTLNIVTNDFLQSRNRITASTGNNDAHSVFSRYGNTFDDGHWGVNVGASRNGGYTGRYADMMSPEQFAALDTNMHTTMRGDMDEKSLSVDSSAQFSQWNAGLRYSRMHYGSYALTPSFYRGNKQVDTNFLANVGFNQALSTKWHFSALGTYSAHDILLDPLDMVSPAVKNSDNYHHQQSERFDIELNSIYNSSSNIEVLLGYRFRTLFNTIRDAYVPTIGLNYYHQNTTSALHDIFYQLSWQVTEKLQLVGGSRLNFAMESQGENNDRTTHEKNTVIYQEGGNHYSVPNIAAIYAVNTHHTFKLLYGEALQDHSDVNFSQPENFETYELNYLYSYPTVSLNISAYQSTTKNLLRFAHQLNNTTLQYDEVSANNGLNTSEGIELIAQYHPSPFLKIELSAAHQHTDDIQYHHINAGESPERLLKAKLSYQHNKIRYGISFRYVGKMLTDYRYLSSQILGDYRRIGEQVSKSQSLDLNIRYAPKLQGFFTQLHIENMTDNDIRYPTNGLIDLEQGLIVPGRTIVLTAGWEY